MKINIGGPQISVPLGFAEKYGTEAINSAKLGLYTIAQIEEKKYEAILLDKGFIKEQIYKYGFAFEGKKVLIG